jgi:hypothetical protein
MKTLIVDIVGPGLQSEKVPLSRRVKGAITINTGNEQRDEQIYQLFHRAGMEASLLLGNPVLAVER